MRITGGVIVRGAGLAHLWGDALILLAMAFGLLLWSAKRFNKIIAP